MRVTLCLLLSAVCVLADKNGNHNRRTKPFIADAVGNTLPPPSNGPATVGSPINLLTPDRYEFYTFDESGELVKRLMTLEEIQAIVAAGEDSEGLVTFANDNQPTIAFNFSQPPYTKVHSVVTNVQNVLKAQMEAHKNRPLVQPTLDTPDVSDSWSLILPSIFGNAGGGDIVPDKPTSSFTPETDTIEASLNANDAENSLSKEGDTKISTSTTVKNNNNDLKTTAAETIKTNIASTTSTTTAKTTTIKTINHTSAKPLSTTTIRNKLLTTTRPRTTTTKPPATTRLTTTTTTVKPIITTSAPRITSTKPITTSTKQTLPTTISNVPTAKPNTEYEKISTFIPISTVKYVTERTTRKPAQFTKAPFVYAATTKRSPLTSTKLPQPLSSTQIPKLQTTLTTPSLSTNTTAAKASELEKDNFTTITTQSVSPSTTASSTEFLSPEHSPTHVADNSMNEEDVALPLFDVAQSISQIASDLGNNYQPLPTSSNLLDNTKLDDVEMESKENLEMDIPIYEQINNKDKNDDNFVKISTIDPHPQEKKKESDQELENKDLKKVTTEVTSTNKNEEPTSIASLPAEGTTMDPILTESMGDLLSQVVHEAPQSILDAEKSNFDNDANKPVTTEKTSDFTTNLPIEISSSKYVSSTVPNSFVNPEKQELNKVTIVELALNNTTADKENKLSFEKDTSVKETTEKVGHIKVTTEKQILINSITDKEAPIKVTTDKVTPIKVTTDSEITNKATTEKETLMKLSTENELIIQVTTEKESPIKITTVKETPVQVTTEKQTLIKSTTENMISSEKELTKIVSPVSNKVSTEMNNKNEKGDESKDFVKISISAIKNTSNIETNQHKHDIAKITENTENYNKSTIPQKHINNDLTKIDLVTKLEDNEPTLEAVTTFPDLDITTKPNKFSIAKNKTVASSQPNNVNKLSLGEKGSLNINKDKIIEPFPKIEEFKKKIQKVNDEELAHDRNDPWKLIPTVTPSKGNDISKDKPKPDSTFNPSSNENKDVVLEFSKENQGLEVTTKDLGEDVAQFTELCNELAFRYWSAMVENIDKKRTFVLSPYSITSMLAMMFMGARGATSGEMNEILKLDDMVTFNPHFTLKNISDSIESATNSGIVVSAFVRELFSDRNKGKILIFYKERAQHFYSGHVEEINFKLISDIIRRRTNLLVKKHTWGKIPEYMKTNSIVMKPPLAAFSTNIFQTDCTGTSVDGRDGEMYFVVSPNVRQRRLVPVPAVVYKSGFLAGYDPVLDATAASLGNTNSIVSTIFLMPGQQGNIVHADDLVKLEQRLLEANPTTPVWNRVLRTLLPRIGLELQIPRFSHKSVFNVSSTLKEMGLKDLFDADHADLGGLNGPSKDLYLSDMVQMTSFVTCGEGMISDQHHIEDYPETVSVARRRTSRWADWDEPRDYQRAFHDPHDVGEAMHLPLHLRPRQARVPTRSVQPARLKFDRPFLFFVRHNPSGMILYVGRYNPRLLP